MKDFRNLKVWEKSHQLALAVYKATSTFPRHELYGLTSQIRRACASIPANIAEGCGRSGDAELARFLQIAMGSASELEYHLLLPRDLRFLPAPTGHQPGGWVKQRAQQTAKIMARLELAVPDHRPDWMLVYGDVNFIQSCSLVGFVLHLSMFVKEMRFGSNRHGSGGTEMTTLTSDELLDTIAELPVERQETLVDLVRLRLREQRRKEFARNAAEARAQFAAGQLPRGTVGNLLADWRTG